MAKNKFKYYVPDVADADCPEEFESAFDADSPEWLAEDAAEDYHNNCDGWESEWPVTFVLLTMDGQEIGRFLVERETVPQFSATKM